MRKKSDMPLGQELIKRMPPGWTIKIQKMIRKANESLPEDRQLPTNPGSIYNCAQRQNIKNPLWPFVVKVALEAISLEELKRRQQELEFLQSA